MSSKLISTDAFNLKIGTWIFTCEMKPKQFQGYQYRDHTKYSVKWHEMTPLEKMKFAYDDFTTLDGANHSISNCSCREVSEKYALWFIENKIDELWEPIDTEEADRWKLYEDKVRAKCIEAGIEYEGI